MKLSKFFIVIALVLFSVTAQADRTRLNRFAEIVVTGSAEADQFIAANNVGFYSRSSTDTLIKMLFASTSNNTVIDTAGASNFVSIRRNGTEVYGMDATTLYIKPEGGTVAQFSTAGMTMGTDAKIRAIPGDATTPGYGFNDDFDTGLYKAGVNTLGVSAGGAQVATFDSGGMTLPTSVDGFWSIQDAANQACNTTCTVGACVMGFDFTNSWPVGCDGASADRCLCAGN